LWQGDAVSKHKRKEIDLGKSGTVTLHLSDDVKRLLIEFKVDKSGLTKTDVNWLIPQLKNVREKMMR
jgi:hypothetical protein